MRRRSRAAAILPVLLIATAIGARGATYYVSKSGSDSNSGSQSSPWLTISKAANVAKAGDTVNVAAGSYPETVNLLISGTASSGALFQGTGQPVIVGSLNIRGDYITASGFTVSPLSAGQGAINVGGTHNLLSNCTVTNYGATASDQATAISTGGSFNQVDHCSVLNLNDIDAFHLWGDHITISNNTVSNVNMVNYALNHTDFIQTWGLQPSQNATFIYIYGNLVENSTCDIGNTETDGNPNLHDWYIYNNIFNKVDSPFFSGLPNTWIFNNLFINGGEGGAAVELDFYTDTAGDQSGGSTGKSYDSNGSKVQNNVFINNAGNIATGGNAGSLSQMTITNNYFDKNPIGSAALTGNATNFVNASGLDFRLKPGSVLIGKGVNLSSVFTVDRDGNPRPATGTWDIGPYQSKSTPPRPAPKH
jgi:hypothetical protein